MPETFEVVSVIDPDYDELLDDPAWINHDSSKYRIEKIERIKLCEGPMNLLSCDKAITLFNERHK